MRRVVSVLIAMCVLIGLVPMAACAAGTSVELAVKACNITFTDSVYLEYAVPAGMADDVRLLIWNGQRASYTMGTQDAILESERTATIGGVDCLVFVYRGMTAKQMTDVFYARPVADKDTYGKLHKYSVLEYAYKKLGKIGTNPSTNSNFITLMESVLVYGGNVQRYLGYNTGHPANADYYQVLVADGVLSDGFTSGLYLTGESVQVTALETNAEGVAFHHWEDSTGAVIGSTAALTITVGAKNETYTAKYGVPQIQKPTPSQGLEIEVTDGEATVIGIGTCTDDFVVLPDTYEEVPVTAIEATAFLAETFTSIYIPRTITDIGSKAFRGCDLTTVYYEGTEEEWAAITVGAYNEPLVNAQKFFESYGPAPVSKYTVTFKDYNGAVLKTEQVGPGENATPPVDPTREGYVFLGWQGSYTNIQTDTDITARYEEITDPVIVVGSSYAKAGEQISIPICLKNNPGIAASILKVSYDSNVLTMDSFAYGDQFRDGGETPPDLNSPVTLTWSSVASVSGDVTYAVLTFTVNQTAQSGAVTDVTVSYNTSDIINIDEADVVFEIRNGTITVQ